MNPDPNSPVSETQSRIKLNEAEATLLASISAIVVLVTIVGLVLVLKNWW